MKAIYKTLLIGIALCSAACANESTPMVTPTEAQATESTKTQKLVHIKSQFTLVEFIGKDTLIHDRILEKEMTENGILIPPALRHLYQGKEAIRLGEEEFQRAFKDIFAIHIFDSTHYSWQE